MAHPSRTKKRKQRRRTSHHHTPKHKQTGGILDEQAKQVVSRHWQQREEDFGKMLRATCKNAGTCLAIGEYDLFVKAFFEEFVNFDYLDKKNVQRIGAPSANGFVLELPFVRDGYKAFVVMKCAAKQTSDNLFYEYLVGRAFLNNYVKVLPTFLETYDLYEFNSDLDYAHIVDYVKHDALYLDTVRLASRITRIDTENWSTLKQLRDAVGNSCLKNKRLCMTVQHFDKFYTLQSRFSRDSLYKAFMPDLQNVLFQVYFALNMLGNNYTHYDLHANNVMLYKPFEGKQCILMRYHTANNLFEFKSEYLAKIIDYGRNYFNRGKLNTTVLVREALCARSECEPKCGRNVGYHTIQGSALGSANVVDWIDPIRPNASHDLRLAHLIFNVVLRDPSMPKVVYKGNYGTPESHAEEPGKAFNIRQLWMALARNSRAFNQRYTSHKYDASWKVVATMDVYSNGQDYTFTVHPDV